MSKRHAFGPQLLVATCALVATLMVGCVNSADRTVTDADTRSGVGRPVSMSSAQKKPVDLTGCLQKLSGSYLLTETNRSSPDAEAAGRQGERASVEGDRLNVLHAYRLSAGDKDRLEKLVGKKVKVSGSVTETSDPVAREDRRFNDLIMVGTSGVQDKETDHPAIKPGSLSKVDVASIQQVGEGCGGER
jgi:hypothetical protein